LIASISSFGQSVSDIFEYKAITFYGLDFSMTKCTGIGEFPDGNELVKQHFTEWNNAFMVGKKRVEIGAPYHKKKVEYDTLVYSFNRQMNPDELIIDKPQVFKKSMIPEFVSKYANSKKAGIGLVYIVENLNAREEYVSVWITFFNIGTGEVLLSEPSRAQGKGRKFNQHWLNAFMELYLGSEKDYKTWEKLYN
jgi:hypothetical protein